MFLVSALVAALPVACGRAQPGAATGATLPAPPDVAAPPAGSLKTTSGLSTLVLAAGTGTRHPRLSDRVTVHYTGWTTDGQMFDSSVAQRTAGDVRRDGVITGWTEGLQMMVEGEKRRFWIPEALAYEGQPGQPQGHAGVRRRAAQIQ